MWTKEVYVIDVVVIKVYFILRKMLQTYDVIGQVVNAKALQVYRMIAVSENGNAKRALKKIVNRKTNDDRTNLNKMVRAVAKTLLEQKGECTDKVGAYDLCPGLKSYESVICFPTLTFQSEIRANLDCASLMHLFQIVLVFNSVTVNKE